MKKVFKNWELILLAVFILMAAALRFNNITKLQFFTYDQSRDALFVKRMIVDGEFRLLGTQTSLPGMYLPPFYFYTIAPVLWLSSLNPVGIDIYSALVGVLTIPAIFWIANRVFGRPAGVFSAGLFAVSPLVVELTRRAWNPNTLPFFILITFYFFYQYYRQRQTRDFLLAFAFYGYCLSLHFGAWTLLPLFVFIGGFYLFKEKNFRGVLAALAVIFFFVSPLLFFELRHQFFLTGQAKLFFFDGGHLGPSGNFFEPLFSSLIALFTILISGKITVGYGAPLEFSGRIKDLVASQPISVVAQKPFSLSFQWWGTLIFVLIAFFSLYCLFKKKMLRPLLMIWIWILWGVFASRMYSGKFFFFYYLFLFPAPILLFGFLGQRAWQAKKLRPAVLLAFFLIIGFHLRYTTVFQPAWRDINDLRAVGGIIAENTTPGKTFNLVTIQKEADRWDRNSVDYRYFVETFGQKRALDWYPENYRQAQELFVIDEEGRADAMGSTIMEIQAFKPGQIIDKWKTDKGIAIYKLSKKEN